MDVYYFENENKDLKIGKEKIEIASLTWGTQNSISIDIICIKEMNPILYIEGNSNIKVIGYLNPKINENDIEEEEKIEEKKN